MPLSLQEKDDNLVIVNVFYSIYFDSNQKLHFRFLSQQFYTK